MLCQDYVVDALKLPSQSLAIFAESSKMCVVVMEDDTSPID